MSYSYLHNYVCDKIFIILSSHAAVAIVFRVMLFLINLDISLTLVMQSLGIKHVLRLPSGIFLLKNDEFYSVVRNIVGETLASYLKFLNINSADCLVSMLSMLNNSAQRHG